MPTTQQNRINTIIAIINSSPSLTSTNVNKLKTEFRQVIAVDTIAPPKRKHILKILHSTRALDSTLKAILDHYHIRNGKHSIGQYITQFTNHTLTTLGKLSPSERAKYQREIADIRNTHLHNADSYPRNDSEVYQLISEMQALITRVTSL
jgi:hypothetical protein